MYFQTLFCVVACCLETVISKFAKLEKPVDLTWAFDNGTIYWTVAHPYTLNTKITEVREEGVWRQSNHTCASEYGGTHFVAPNSYNKWGWKVEDVPLSRLIVRGITIDLSQETATLHSAALLLPEHLEAWKKGNGPIPENSVILVHFGWSQYYSDKAKYFGIDEQNNFNFPGISLAAAEWIVNTGSVVGVGVDTPSIEPGSNLTLVVHKLFSKNQMYVVANLKIPPEFPEDYFKLYVMPMKMDSGISAPLRIVAVPFNPDDLPPTVPFIGHILVVVSSLIILTLYMITEIGI